MKYYAGHAKVSRPNILATEYSKPTHNGEALTHNGEGNTVGSRSDLYQN